MSPDAWPRKWCSSPHRAGWRSHRCRSFRTISTISCLSKPITRPESPAWSQTSLVAPKDCTVWEATWPMLSPVISADGSRTLFRNGLGDPHHIAAHDDGQLLVGALVIDIELDVGEIHHMQLDGARVAGPPGSPGPPPSAWPGRWYRAAHGNRPRRSSRRAWRSCNPPPGCRCRRTSSSMALPLVPTGMPPGPGIITENRLIFWRTSTRRSTSGLCTSTFISGKRFQNHLAQVPVDLVGAHGILLVAPAGIHLKGNVLVRIDLVHVLHHTVASDSHNPCPRSAPWGRCPRCRTPASGPPPRRHNHNLPLAST